jgi:hypothetical protein
MSTVLNVVLRDFDGTETIYPVDASLPEVIGTGDSDSGIQIRRSYVKTALKDAEGRIIYQQRN